MVNLADTLSSLWNTYQLSTFELTVFVGDTQRAITEISEKHGLLAEKLKKFQKGEKVEHQEINEKAISVELSQEQMDFLVTLMAERVEIIGKYPYLLMTMAFIYLVALFDGFLTDVFTAVLIERPEVLRSKKQLTYDKILELQQKDELIEFMAHREINELSYKSMKDQADYYESKFNIVLADSNVELTTLIEIRARRNLLVHNNGVINDTYLETVDQTSHPLGHRLEITFDYWNECKEQLNSVVSYVHKSVIEKFIQKEQQLVDWNAGT